MNPTISIIVPVFNKKKYLESCLESISGQSMFDYELILVDDGSTDESLTVCEKYSAIDDRIKIIKTKHNGASSARNTGLNIAKGKYICFIDADDIVDKDYLKGLYKDADKYDCVCSNVKLLKSIKNKKNKYHQDMIIKKEKAMKMALTLSDDIIYGSQCGKLFCKYIIDRYNIRFNDKATYCEDILFVITYFNYCKRKILWINESYYKYIKRNDGMSKSRYIGKSNIIDGTLTEYETLIKCKKYTNKFKYLKRTYYTRLIKAAVATIREYTIKEQTNNDKYKKLLKMIRMNCIYCMLTPTVSLRNKISILICGISPKLEARLWLKEEGEL